MKIIKTASGKSKIKISRSEWQSIGKKAGWMKGAGEDLLNQQSLKDYGVLKIPLTLRRLHEDFSDETNGYVHWEKTPNGDIKIREITTDDDICTLYPDKRNSGIRFIGNGFIISEHYEDMMEKIKEHEGLE